jgi:hypothetical protein
MDFGYKPQGDMDIVRGFMAKSVTKVKRLSINDCKLVLNKGLQL